MGIFRQIDEALSPFRFGWSALRLDGSRFWLTQADYCDSCIAGDGRKTLHDKVAELHCVALCRGNNSLRHGNEGKTEEPESIALESLLKCAELLLGQRMFVVRNVFAIWQQSSEKAVNLAESDRFLQHDETSRTEDSPHFFSCPWNLKMGGPALCRRLHRPMRPGALSRRRIPP